MVDLWSVYLCCVVLGELSAGKTDTGTRQNRQLVKYLRAQRKGRCVKNETRQKLVARSTLKTMACEVEICGKRNTTSRAETDDIIEITLQPRFQRTS